MRQIDWNMIVNAVLAFYLGILFERNLPLEINMLICTILFFVMLYGLYKNRVKSGDD